MGTPRPPVVTVTLFVPGQLRSRLNGSGSRAHWSKISEESRRWKDRTLGYWLGRGQPTLDGPAVVTFTAYVGRLWDSDNLPAAIKSIRDESVRLILRTSDGPDCGHEFRYEQAVRRDPSERGILITIEPRPDPRGLGGTR